MKKIAFILLFCLCFALVGACGCNDLSVGGKTFSFSDANISFENTATYEQKFSFAEMVCFPFDPDSELVETNEYLEIYRENKISELRGKTVVFNNDGTVVYNGKDGTYTQNGDKIIITTSVKQTECITNGDKLSFITTSSNDGTILNISYTAVK